MKLTRPSAVLLIAFILVGVFSLVQPHPASAVQTITVYKSQNAVKLDGIVESSEWSDTPLFTEQFSGMTIGFKQNGTGLLWLMEWSESSPYCTDSACFGGIELGHLNNTAEMGTLSTPTIMILASTSFKANVDEFIATGDATPQTVESAGYATQSTCGLTLTGQKYAVECYRPFKLNNASPYDFSTLGVGSSVELGFAVGEFTNPGDHLASDMITYVLSITGETYTPVSTTSSSTQQSSSSSVSTSKSSTGQSISTSSVSSTTSLSSTSPTSTSSSASITTTSSGEGSPTSTASTGPTTASTYAEELLVMAIGFSVLILVALAKYERG